MKMKQNNGVFSPYRKLLVPVRVYNFLYDSKKLRGDSRAFLFGENWLKFIKGLDAEQYEEAKKSLCDLLGLKLLAGKSFLDIGCGSGIFSLAAVELGTRKVVSIDVDPKSVEATQKIKMRCQVSHWEIKEGSILDKDFIKNLGAFDIV